jgi:hypothetical protein
MPRQSGSANATSGQPSKNRACLSRLPIVRISLSDTTLLRGGEVHRRDRTERGRFAKVITTAGSTAGSASGVSVLTQIIFILVGTGDADALLTNTDVAAAATMQIKSVTRPRP